MVNGKRKGSAFEREICKKLSLWVSNGKRTDLYWRTAMSGGRASVQHRKGVAVRQVGDICAVSPEGHKLTDYWFIECKFVRSLRLEAFLLSNKGPLAQFWKTACTQADRLSDKQHNYHPMLIAKQNGMPILVITHRNMLDAYTGGALITSWERDCDVTLFSELVESIFLP